MALIHTSSLVFVGGPFSLSMFDERELFGGDLDSDQVVKIGPFGLFVYSSGKHRFEVRPDRVSLTCVDSSIVPQEVVEAANTVANRIEPVRQVIRILGIGVNCDTIFSKEFCGMNGLDFCSRLISPQLADLVGGDSMEAIGRIRFASDAGLRYDVRIEPHTNSGGENLLVAVNGHQDVNAGEILGSKLNKAGVFTDYVTKLHDRISISKGE